MEPVKDNGFGLFSNVAHFTIDDPRSNLDQLYFSAVSSAGVDGVVIQYKARSRKAYCNIAHRATCKQLGAKAHMLGVTNKIVAPNLTDAAIFASIEGVEYRLCKFCFRDKESTK